MHRFWIRAELEEAAFRGDEVRALGDSARRAIETAGLLKRAENLRMVECDACGAPHIEEVEVFDTSVGKPRAYIFCPDTGRVAVAPERLQVWRIDFESLTALAASALGLSGAPRAIVDGRLWLLGTACFGNRTRDVFVVRGARWPDGRRVLDDNARMATSPCPLILVPNLLPDDSVWTENERLVLSMAEFEWCGNDPHSVLRKITTVVAEYDRRRPHIEEAAFRKQGEMWILTFGGKTVHVADSLGMAYIVELLRVARVPLEAAVLAGTSVEATQLVQAPGIPMGNEKTLQAVRTILAEKKAEFARLKKGDWTRKGTLEQEIRKLEEYLRQVKTHQGQVRKVAGTAQRARTSVTNAINRAIRHIAAQHLDLGRHLKQSIRTGTALIYLPVEVPDWHF